MAAKKRKKAKACKANTPSKIPAAAQRGKRTPDDPKDWHPEVIAALRVSGLVEESINAVGVGRTTFFDHKRKFPEFAKEVDEIVAAHLEADGLKLARGAMRRALEGEVKIAVELDAKGNKVGEVHTTSFPPNREKFMLKHSLPGTFGSNTDSDDDDPNDLAEKIRDAFAAMTKSLKGPGE